MFPPGCVDLHSVNEKAGGELLDGRTSRGDRGARPYRTVKEPAAGGRQAVHLPLLT